MFGDKIKNTNLVEKWVFSILLIWGVFAFQPCSFSSEPNVDSKAMFDSSKEITPKNQHSNYKHIEVNIGSSSSGKSIELDVIGIASEKQVGLQKPATAVMKDLRQFFYYWLMPIALGIVVLVLILLIWVILRFNKKANPEPARFSHNTLIEIIWTVIPVVILLVIVFPSMQLLFKQERIPKADLTVKATGYQWYWDYAYPDYNDLTYSSVMLKGDEAKKSGRPLLLATDNALVVPAGAVVRVLVTAEDVIHSWTVPSFGIKMDAIPGRVNETWFRVDQPGIYYGQCSELCGTDHAFMPIEIYVLKQEVFDAWMAYKMNTELTQGNPSDKFAALR